MLWFGLFARYCYNLDYRWIYDIGVPVILWGINSVIKLVRCHRTGLFQCNHICLYGKALMWFIVVPLAGASNEGRLWACSTLAR